MNTINEYCGNTLYTINEYYQIEKNVLVFFKRLLPWLKKTPKNRNNRNNL